MSSNKRKTKIQPNKLEEVWENAVNARNENSDLLSNRVFSLSAGGLALSFTVFSFIVGENKTMLGWEALVIWGLYIVCIILDTVSYIYARKKADLLERKTREKIHLGEQMDEVSANALIDASNHPISVINTVVILILMIAIIWSIIYCYILLIHL